MQAKNVKSTIRIYYLFGSRSKEKKQNGLTLSVVFFYQISAVFCVVVVLLLFFSKQTDFIF